MVFHLNWWVLRTKSLPGQIFLMRCQMFAQIWPIYYPCISFVSKLNWADINLKFLAQTFITRDAKLAKKTSYISISFDYRLCPKNYGLYMGVLSALQVTQSHCRPKRGGGDLVSYRWPRTSMDLIKEETRYGWRGGWGEDLAWYIRYNFWTTGYQHDHSRRKHL